MQRWSAEDGDAQKRSGELKKSGEQSKRLQKGLKNSPTSEAPQQFVVCINLGDVPPDNVNATITGRTVNITGERVELLEEEDGMVRQNYQGFSNTFNIPPEVNIDTLNLTICEKHTLLVEADYLENTGALEEYVTQTGPRQSHLKSLDKLSSQETSSLDLASSPTNSSSEASQDSLYESALTHIASRKSLISNGDTSRRGSAAAGASISEKRGSVSQPAASRRSSLSRERTQSIHPEGRRGSASRPAEGRRTSTSPERIQDMQEEGRRGSDFDQEESRRPSIGRERIQSIQEEGRRGSAPHLGEGRRPSMSPEPIQDMQEEGKRGPFYKEESRRPSISQERVQSIHEEGRRGSVSHPGKIRRPSMSPEPIQDMQEGGRRGSLFHLESRRSSMNPEGLHGEEKRDSIFQQDQSKRSSIGSKNRHPVREEGKRGSINKHEGGRRSSTSQVQGKGKRCLKSHQEESRRPPMSQEKSQSMHNKMKRDSKSSTRAMTPSTEKSTNSNETSLDSSDSTISNSSKTSWTSDEAGSTGSIPTSMLSQPSITDTSGVSPKSTRDSFSSRQNVLIPRPANRLSSTVSSSTLIKCSQRLKGAKKEKEITFDSFPFCCCPQSF